MMEVLNIEFLEYRYLQAFVEKIFQYKKKYSSHPSNETMKTIIRSGIDDLNEVTQKQIRDYYAKAMADISILESCEFVKDTAIDFCRKQKLREAMLKSTTLLQKCSFDEISVVINNALKAGADADFGYDYIKDFEERFEFTGRETITTGWKKMDEITGGGGGRESRAVGPSSVGSRKRAQKTRQPTRRPRPDVRRAFDRLYRPPALDPRRHPDRRVYPFAHRAAVRAGEEKG